MKKNKHLDPGQRYKIEAYLKAGWNQTMIAQELGIHKSTVGREIKRNITKRHGYKGAHAQMLSDERKERFKRARRLTSDMILLIEDKIRKEQWSPEQIVGYYKSINQDIVSIERIYQYIRADKNSGGNLYLFLRHRLKHRKRLSGGKRLSIKDRVGIENRPAVVADKSRFGDFEIDTIIGKDKRGAIVTIVERSNGFLLMEKLEKGKNADGLKDAVIRLLLPYKGRIHTITSDNGKEFAEHKAISKALDIDFYFADPYSSWQRGLNEYTNKLVRQYIPKKTDFKEISCQQIKEIQYKLNRRPRKKLEYKNPLQLFFSSLEKKVAFVS